MTKLMMIIGDEKSINEISKYLRFKAQDWYNEGKKEFDADVKIFELGQTTEFHLG